jgi:hypothetical protein
MTELNAGEHLEDGAITVKLKMPRGNGRTRLYRATVRFARENAVLVAEQGYDPEAIIAHWRARDGEWHEVENTEMLRRLRAEAEDRRWRS